MNLLGKVIFHRHSLLKKCPYSEFFCKFLYSVWMGENAYQKTPNTNNFHTMISHNDSLGTDFSPRNIFAALSIYKVKLYSNKPVLTNLNFYIMQFIVNFCYFCLSCQGASKLRFYINKSSISIFQFSLTLIFDRKLKLTLKLSF